MPEMKTLNGYEIVDAKARQDIANIKHPTKVSELENDKGYLTEHQSLAGYATEQYVDNAIADIPETDLSNYYTKTQVDNKLEIVDDSYFLDFSTAPTLANPATATAEMVEFVEQLRDGKDVCAQIKDSHDDIYYPAIISHYYSGEVYVVYLTKVAGNINLLRSTQCWEWDTICLQHDGTECVYFKGGNNSYEFVSKEYVDSAIENAISVDLTGYATEDYVDTAISNIDIPDCTMQVIDITNVTETPTTITDSYTAAILDRIASGEKLSVCLVNKKMVNTYQFPAYITYDSKNINIGMNLETKKVDVGLYLISLKYKFEKPNTQWQVYSQENSTRLIKYGTED